jgi:hypothetical protein
MSDAELIARLRAYREHDEGSGGMASFEVDECIEAADRIEAMTAKLAKAVEALDRLARLGNGDRYGNSEGNVIARATLAEIKGENHE